MARGDRGSAKREKSRAGRNRVALDERGGSPDGGVAIIAEDGSVIHMTPPRVATSLRFLVARVQVGDDQGLPQRLAITSALRGEGVTYVARSLAAVVSYDSGESVAVVDLNWRAPVSNAGEESPRHPTAGDATRGVADAVSGGAAIDDIITPTSNPKLSLIAAGAVELAQRPALVGSRALEDVMDEIAGRFDHMVIDLPPVLASSEALKLSQLANAYVLVVRQGTTLRSQVEAALEELPQEYALGVVLNRYGSNIPRRLRRVVGA